MLLGTAKDTVILVTQGGEVDFNDGSNSTLQGFITVW